MIASVGPPVTGRVDTGPPATVVVAALLSSSVVVVAALLSTIVVVVVLLTLTGLVSVEKLRASRGYVVIGIFVVAAVLTPPDPLSQLMMAIPMWLLYEAGLIFARILNRGTSRDGSKAAKDGDGESA